MVTEFNGFSKGVIGKKLPADKTLNNMKKKELIELLHVAQHNYETLNWFYNNAVDNSKCNKCPLGFNNTKIRNKAIDDVLEILKKYNVPFHGEANYDILQLKEVEGNG